MITVTTSSTVSLIVLMASNRDQSAAPYDAISRSTLALLPLGPAQTRYRPILARQVAVSIMLHTSKHKGQQTAKLHSYAMGAAQCKGVAQCFKITPKN